MNQKTTRLFSLLCACLLLLAGCGKQTEPQSEPPAPPVSPVQPEEPHQPEGSGVTVESDLSAGQEQSDQGKTLLRWSLSIPRALLNGEPMMNIGNYYDNYKEKRLLSLQEELLPMARQRLEDGTLLGGFEAEEDFAVTRSPSPYLSIRRSCRQYSGGAHESIEEKAENWLLREGDCYLLSLADILPGAQDPRALVLEQAALLARERAAEQPDLFYENYEEAIQQTWQEEDFYLTEEGLGLIFQQYALGPYTSGAMTFEIPFARLGDNLTEELRP